MFVELDHSTGGPEGGYGVGVGKNQESLKEREYFALLARARIVTSASVRLSCGIGMKSLIEKFPRNDVTPLESLAILC
jgi:hypothetical protein